MPLEPSYASAVRVGPFIVCAMCDGQLRLRLPLPGGLPRGLQAELIMTGFTSAVCPDQAIPSAHDHALFAPSETGHLSRDGEALHEVRGYTSRPVAWNLIHTHSAVSLQRRSRERTPTSSTLLAHESMTVSLIVFHSATNQQPDRHDDILLDSRGDRPTVEVFACSV
jgi:hypothetical protein